MSDDDHDKPLPVRRAAETPRGKPTPARDLGGESAPQEPAADAPEVSIEADGVAWTVRVTGRSGGAAGTAAPLLLLGFWRGEAGGTSSGPSREALVVGTSLADLSPAALLEALARANPPVDSERKKPFFAEAGQGRRR